MHKAGLVTAFEDVLLIYTDLIDPNVSARAIVCHGAMDTPQGSG
jgi:hypothetical protein